MKKYISNASITQAKRQCYLLHSLLKNKAFTNLSKNTKIK